MNNRYFLKFFFIAFFFYVSNAFSQKKSDTYLFVNVNGFYDNINNKALNDDFDEFTKVPSHLSYSSFSLELLKVDPKRNENRTRKFKSYALTYFNSKSTNKDSFIDNRFDDPLFFGFDNDFIEIAVEYKIGKILQLNFFYSLNSSLYFTKYKLRPFMTNMFGFDSMRLGLRFGFGGGYKASIFDRVDVKFSLNFNPIAIYYEDLYLLNPNLSASVVNNSNGSIKLGVLQRRLVFSIGISLFRSTKKSRRRIRKH